MRRGLKSPTWRLVHMEDGHHGMHAGWTVLHGLRSSADSSASRAVVTVAQAEFQAHT
jgi:hypothetical protein